MREAYEHTISLYGTELTIYVKPVENSFLTSIRNKLPIILLLLAVNVIFPSGSFRYSTVPLQKDYRTEQGI